MAEDRPDAAKVGRLRSVDLDELGAEKADQRLGGGDASLAAVQVLAEVEALGGRFTVSSPPGRGTTLRAEIPCA